MASDKFAFVPRQFSKSQSAKPTSSVVEILLFVGPNVHDLGRQSDVFPGQLHRQLERDESRERLGAHDGRSSQTEIDHHSFELLGYTEPDGQFVSSRRANACSSGVKSILSETVLREEPRYPASGGAVEVKLDSDVPTRSAWTNPAHGDGRFSISTLSALISQDHLHSLPSTIGRTTDPQPIWHGLNLNTGTVQAEIDQSSGGVVVR